MSREKCFSHFCFSTIQHNSTSRHNQNEISSSTTIDMLKDCSPCHNKLVKTSDKHAKFLLKNLDLLRKQKELCDVILNVGQNKIPAHRAVLSGALEEFSFRDALHLTFFGCCLACSPYFKAMFTGELAESRQTEIILHDLDETAMDLLIDYCYTSQIIVDEKNVQTLLPAACILQVNLDPLSISLPLIGGFRWKKFKSLVVNFSKNN